MHGDDSEPGTKRSAQLTPRRIPDVRSVRTDSNFHRRQCSPEGLLDSAAGDKEGDLGRTPPIHHAQDDPPTRSDQASERLHRRLERRLGVERPEGGVGTVKRIFAKLVHQLQEISRAQKSRRYTCAGLGGSASQDFQHPRAGIHPKQLSPSLGEPDGFGPGAATNVKQRCAVGERALQHCQRARSHQLHDRVVRLTAVVVGGHIVKCDQVRTESPSRLTSAIDEGAGACCPRRNGARAPMTKMAASPSLVAMLNTS